MAQLSHFTEKSCAELLRHKKVMYCFLERCVAHCWTSLTTRPSSVTSITREAPATDAIHQLSTLISFGWKRVSSCKRISTSRWRWRGRSSKSGSLLQPTLRVVGQEQLTVDSFSISSSDAPSEANPISCENCAKLGSASSGMWPSSSWMQSLKGQKKMEKFNI